MKQLWPAAAAALCCGLQLTAGDIQREVLSIAYAKEAGLVAAAYRGGEVVLWEFESGAVKKVFNLSPPKDTLNKPLAQFSAAGKRLALTQEGDAGLIAYDTGKGTSAVLVPRRLLVQGITSIAWAHQTDSLLVSIGRDIFLINAAGHTQWQRRLETRAIITSVAWHPSEKFYTVATDNGEVSTWETISGRVIAASKLQPGGHSTPVKVGWMSEDTIIASVRGVSLAVLDPETLKPQKSSACNCQDFDWIPDGKEIFAWDPPNISVFSPAGARERDIKTPFSGESPIVWAGEGRLLTAFEDGAVVLRDSRTGKVLRTFSH